MQDPTVLILGAGVSGLACARELARRGVSCRVLERSNAVGGRAATLEWHGVRVDPGLPFLHARSAEFGDVLNELDPSGKVVGWPSEVITPRLAALPDSLKPGYRRMARRAGIGEFAAHALAEDDGRLVVETATGDRMAAPFVVVATPIAECLRLCASLVRMWPDADILGAFGSAPARKFMHRKLDGDQA